MSLTWPLSYLHRLFQRGTPEKFIVHNRETSRNLFERIRLARSYFLKLTFAWACTGANSPLWRLSWSIGLVALMWLYCPHFQVSRILLSR